MKKSLPAILLILGVVCLFVPWNFLGKQAYYVKVLGLLLAMFAIYSFSKKVTSKEDSDSGNFKF